LGIFLANNVSERGFTGFACGWSTKSPFRIYPASKASVEGEAPSGFAGGGGDASPFK
jgi:hypothetical protein